MSASGLNERSIPRPQGHGGAHREKFRLNSTRRSHGAALFSRAAFLISCQRQGYRCKHFEHASKISCTVTASNFA